MLVKLLVGDIQSLEVAGLQLLIGDGQPLIDL
jgi:hypothetical protein